jgi:hypothetical protein
MTQSLASAADYADALITARRAKNLLWSITTLLVLAEIVLFFVARYKADFVADTPTALVLRDLIAVVDFMGLILPLLLDVALLVIVGIMLVGRLIGVSKVLTAFFWSALITVLLFPWQALLLSTELKIPGVLYNWTELVTRAKFHPTGFGPSLLYWARFVGWPVLAVFVLTLIQSNSRRGLQLAFGETVGVPTVVIQP